MKKIPTLVYYITAHGYGHGVRSCDIIRALRREAPELRIMVVSDLPVDFLRSRLDLPMEAYRAGSFDVGMVQLDSIRVDVPATLIKVQSLMKRGPALIESERQFLRAHAADVVVCDIPSLPMEAARAEGLPVVAVGNFAWDWIYQDFAAEHPAWPAAVDYFQRGYANADVLLRLPFAEPMTIFPRREDIPLVAAAGVARRSDIARAYHVDEKKTWVLLSFTTLDWNQAALAEVEKFSDYAFLTVRPLGWTGRNFFAIDRHQFSFSDVIASCDMVVSKPGYGILSECVVNNKILVYAERENFREYPVLEAALKRHLRHVHIPSRELYAGKLGGYLERASHAAPALQPIGAGGDVIAARRMIEFLPD